MNRCKHSKCIDGVATYTCQCAPGWTAGGEGKRCEGLCVRLLSHRYIYIYIYIYSESNVNLNHFHIDINECAGDKCHGGNECINGENQFECKCGQGWQGGGVNASCEGVAGA